MKCAKRKRKGKLQGGEVEVQTEFGECEGRKEQCFVSSLCLLFLWVAQPIQGFESKFSRIIKLLADQINKVERLRKLSQTLYLWQM